MGKRMSFFREVSGKATDLSCMLVKKNDSGKKFLF